MAFIKVFTSAVETAACAVAAGVQLGLNEKTNEAVCNAAEGTQRAAVTVGLDVAGFATNTLAPAMQMAGHGVATAGLALADAATLHQVDSLHECVADQAQKTAQKARQTESGMARVCNMGNEAFNSSPRDRGCWMHEIPDDRLLTDLWLPGTHETMALYGGDLAQCQRWTLEEQLRAGIRAFDIRLRLSGTALCAHHGIIYQRRNFGSIRDAMEAYLEENPSEMLFVRLSSSGCNHDPESPVSFKPHLKSYLEGPMWRHRSTDITTADATLGSLRGSIVAFEGPLACGSMMVDCQDEWNLGCADKKCKVVLDHAVKPRESKTLYVNYLSAAGVDGMTVTTPSGMAYQVNKRALRAVDSMNPGVYMMDYPGAGLINALIERNF